jgi:putative salt-induced outer membrane protein YdiY
MKSYQTLCSLVTLWATLVACVFAEEKRYDLRINGGLTLTDGNSDTLLVNTGIKYESERATLGAIRLNMEGNYGETRARNEKETNTENIKADANARRDIHKKNYVYAAGSALYDKISLVDYRFILGPGAGWFLIRSEIQTLTVEAGPSYIWEQVDDKASNHLAFRLSQRFERRLSETARIWQQTEYLPKAEDFNDYLLTSEIGIEAAVSSRVHLRLVAQSAYDNQPANAELKKHDLTIISGLSVAL